ncbi:MAG: hypothetical protein LRY69_02300 [Gammaproteobacteria bacterium]|nr:hypothetical protein [Gammaproteobacteria bacterium]
MKIDHIRREFSTPPLLIDDLPSNPYDVFHSWFFDVLHAKIEDPTALRFCHKRMKTIFLIRALFY